MRQSILEEQKCFQRCPQEGAALQYLMQQQTELYASYTWQCNVVDNELEPFMN